MQNIYPAQQITDKKRLAIEAHVTVLSNRFGISDAQCREVLRVGYETGWNDALETPDASTFSRLTPNAAVSRSAEAPEESAAGPTSARPAG